MREKLLSPFLDVVTKTSTNGDRIPVLDGVRGLAVFIVLLSHTSALGMHGQGSLGVFLFYFLSGYVLSLPFVRTPDRMLHRGAWLKYLKNRAFRLAPIYFVVVGITGFFLHEKMSWFLWNLSFIKGWNHFWSVAQEARFYILFPMIVVVLACVRPLVRPLVLLALATVAFYWKDFIQVDMLDGRHAHFFFYVFLAGSFTCQLVSMLSPGGLLTARVSKLILSATSTIIFASFFLTSDWAVKRIWEQVVVFPPGTTLNGWAMPRVWVCLFFLFFVSVTLNADSWIGRLLASYPMRHLGILSYGIYLIHMVPLLKLQQLGFNGNGLFLLTFLSSYVFAFICYVCVEKPFLALKKSG